MQATADIEQHRGKILLEQIETLYDSMWSLLFINLFVSLSLSVALWNKVPSSHIFIWMGMMLLMLAVRGLIYARFRSSFKASQAQRYKNFIILGSACAGVVWGVAGVLLFPANSFEYQLFLLLSLLAMAAGSAFSLSIYLPAYFAYVPLSLIPIAIKLISLGDTIYLVLGAVTLIFLAAMTSFNIRLNQNFTKTLLLRYENLELIEQLQNQKAEAERANAAKSKFLAAASHDLRQPLYSLGLFASVLDEKVAGADSRKVVSQIHRSVNALQSLFDKLLDISQLDAGVIKANKSDMPLAAIIGVLSNDFDEQAAENNLTIRWPMNALWVHSEPVLLEQILRNLISNAIRYTAEGGIVVAARIEDGSAVISVADTGKGIPEDALQDIFVEFHQLENSGRDREKGLGLGLSIVARTAALLGHTIDVNSSVGEGSTFSVILEKADQPANVEARDEEKASSVPYDDSLLVLIVDDEAAIREGMGQLLQLWGCSVCLAASGAEAARNLADAGLTPGAIISDYRLAEGEVGVDVITAIRETCQRDIPALLITGDIEKDRLVAIAESGFYVLHKPVPPNKLRYFLQQAVAEA